MGSELALLDFESIPTTADLALASDTLLPGVSVWPFWQPLPIHCIANWVYHTCNRGCYEYQASAHETISLAGVYTFFFSHGMGMLPFNCL